jgi:tetratricopeptide (TPR) repeat protein
MKPCPIKSESHIITALFTVLFAFSNLLAAIAENSQTVTNAPFTINRDGKSILEKYVVQKGDTLWNISSRYNASIRELTQLNNLTGEHIYVGQRLVIPLKPLNRAPISNENRRKSQELIRRGNVYRDQENYEKAFELFHEAVNLDPNNLNALYSIGFSNLKLGRHHKAIESFIKAIKIDPYNPDSHYNLGLVYLDMREKKFAFEQYKILKILDKNYATRLLMYIDSLK